jgi:transcription elongation GreA/GreB family factor
MAEEKQYGKDAYMRRTSDHAAVADLPSAASASYVQAEQTAQNTKINEILDVLRDAELIPPS